MVRVVSKKKKKKEEEERKKKQAPVIRTLPGRPDPEDVLAGLRPSEGFRPSTGEVVRVTQTPRTAEALARPRFQIGGGAVAGGVSANQAQRAAQGEQLAREQAGKQFLEEREFSFGGEGRPTRQQLDREQGSFVENAPVIGPTIAAVASFLDLAKEGDINPLLQNPEGVREAAIQKIQKKVLREGLTARERFGTFIEGIPIVGSLSQKYASGLIEDPSTNVQTVVKEVKDIQTVAMNMREKARAGTMGDPYFAFQQMEDLEDDMARAEQRIKILADSSPQLQADADSLNQIETTILGAKMRIFDAKQSAAAGIVAQASDSNVFLTLKELGKS